jgi:hypothetical protein
MSSRTIIAIATVVVLTALATLYIYWTRTPQYTLLHVLNAHATAGYEATAAYIETEPRHKKRLHVPRRPEKMIQHLTQLQNDTLAQAYHVTVEDSRIEGNTATLQVKVGETAYHLTFEERKDGRWTLMEFAGRQAFSQRAIKGMKPHPLMIISRL